MADDEDTETIPLVRHQQKKNATTKKTFLTLGVGFILVAIGFIVGILVGAYLIKQVDDSGPCLGPGVPNAITEDADPTISKKILDGINATNIRENLMKLTVNPHLGGTPADEEVLAGFVSDTWKQQGLDYVTSMTYDVLLSYPEKDVPNQVYILDQNGAATFSSAIKEDVLVPGQNKSDVVQPFAAYSAPGTVEGDLVYVNYGRLEDFRKLTEEHNINVEGRIVIVRYGEIFRGDKAKFAEQYKAKGVIVFSDPIDCTNMSDPDNVFPNSWWLPPSGVQRGSYFAEKGDPLTPAYPSIASAYRVPVNETALPKIPIQPISYRDAKHFLELMGGAEAPDEWQGGISNVTYRLGPGFDQTHAGWKVKLDVHTANQRTNTTNVMGVIRGNVEPDRYVILGNHRDAWVFGGADPSSGTAVMLELSRVIADLVKQGWRPKRSLLFCSWGSEEPGLVGSFEWVEEFIKVLDGRAVVYLNVDTAVGGHDYTAVDAMPLLYDALYEAAQKVATPNSQGKTLYDEWLAANPGKDIDGRETGRPAIGQLGAGSDQAPFMVESGVTAADFSYTYGAYWNVTDYPLYHTAYDLFVLVDKFHDPGFTHSRAIAQMWGELARNIADSLLLPLNASTYARELHQYVQLLDRQYGDIMRDRGISLDQLYAAAGGFIQSADDFHTRRDKINRKNPLEVRQYNDQLMQVERAFLDPQGLPDHPLYCRHVVFAPSTVDSYSGSSFPGLSDLLFDIEKSPDPERQWDQVRRHLAAVIFAVRSAALTLRDVEKLSQ